jgi:hypothetical protein
MKVSMMAFITKETAFEAAKRWMPFVKEARFGGRPFTQTLMAADA